MRHVELNALNDLRRISIVQCVKNSISALCSILHITLKMISTNYIESLNTFCFHMPFVHMSACLTFCIMFWACTINIEYTHDINVLTCCFEQHVECYKIWTDHFDIIIKLGHADAIKLCHVGQILKPTAKHRTCLSVALIFFYSLSPRFWDLGSN